jgi:hypothetical protein
LQQNRKKLKEKPLHQHRIFIMIPDPRQKRLIYGSPKRAKEAAVVADDGSRRPSKRPRHVQAVQPETGMGMLEIEKME